MTWQLLKSTKSFFSLRFSFSFSLPSLLHTDCCGLGYVGLEWFCSYWGSSEWFSLFINETNDFSAALISLWYLLEQESNFGMYLPSALDHHGHDEAHLQRSPNHLARDAGGGIFKCLCARRNSAFRTAYPSLKVISHVLQNGLGVWHGNGKWNFCQPSLYL